ncbi:protein-(glutamine-N5) methyltransferase, release factor-specific [Desulfurivibrio alkaliphilus AHT 2]|uniref:Release factor glutamine methyltransferase n=1 Tax=Desulfurivibrio alkaliphilus (strain DSM 19089 / UNIQEM U267 / AHT2) TaxID=589865 RepID=D6Z160_DESAT|nr:protein-(glutamine-N5) methyltransferase, release factor-specific [Desulfurivibrio alkaliphilus AHT 2]
MVELPAGARIGELRVVLIDRLRRAGIEEAAIEADLLLGWVLNCDRAGLVLAAEQPLAEPLRQRLQAALKRRESREPLAYIMGEWEFWSLPFAVGPAVLIPRPETELLVEQALAFVRQLQRPPGGRYPWRILDLGTGSGILAVVLAREIASAQVVALDRSPAALAMARANARRHGVAEKITFVGSDWLSALAARPAFDLVVANPPYVCRSAMLTLQPEVREHEPHTALDGGRQGLDDIKIICRDLPAVLRPDGLLLLEIGWDQKTAAAELFNRNPAYRQTEIINDLAGLPRVLRCRKEEC